MINFKRILLIAVLFLFGILITNSVYAEIENSYILYNGKIIHITSEGCNVINMPNRVEEIYHTTKGVYFIIKEIKRKKDKLIIGEITDNSGKYIINYIRSVDIDYDIVRRFVIDNGICYILVTKTNQEDKISYSFITMKLSGNDVDIRHNINDFMLINHSVALMIANNWGQSLEYKDERIELSLNGPADFCNNLNDRLIVISDSNYTEIIDIIQMKSICYYPNQGECLGHADNNFVLSFVDTFDSTKSIPDKMVFYKIFIDGIEMVRTDTGHSEVEKKIEISLEPGTHHIIKLERWELNPARNRYERLNNIYQPDEIRLSISENRVYSLYVEYDGNEYKINKKVQCIQLNEKEGVSD